MYSKLLEQNPDALSSGLVKELELSVQEWIFCA